eukprot:3234528-Prymnesium_polylepis.2
MCPPATTCPEPPALTSSRRAPPAHTRRRSEPEAIPLGQILDAAPPCVRTACGWRLTQGSFVVDAPQWGRETPTGAEAGGVGAAPSADVGGGVSARGGEMEGGAAEERMMERVTEEDLFGEASDGD